MVQHTPVLETTSGISTEASPSKHSHELPSAEKNSLRNVYLSTNFLHALHTAGAQWIITQWLNMGENEIPGSFFCHCTVTSASYRPQILETMMLGNHQEAKDHPGEVMLSVALGPSGCVSLE